MNKVRLFHWRADEAEVYKEVLTKAGFAVDYEEQIGTAVMRALRESAPEAVVIDLSRLPSHGREVAIAIRNSRKTRAIPIVFCDGEAEKVKAVRQLLPDALYCSSAELVKTLKSARPVTDAVQPSGMMNRYETRTAAQKLGLREGGRIAVYGAPKDAERVLGKLPNGATMMEGEGDVTLCFVHSADELRERISEVRRLAARSKLWILWRKKGVAGHNGVTDRLVRETGIDLGLVDYKICSVDAVWSGLLFAARKKSKHSS